MIDYSIIFDYLQKNLSSKRYNHSINVSNEAIKLAKYHDCDTNKAKLAGLVHDCAKDISIQEQEYYAKNCGFFVDSITYKIPELIHAPASVYVCKKVFKITDIEVLSSIRYHTTGKADMSLIEKIIFISDIIEPSREFKDVEMLRKLAYENLDEALLYALDSSIIYIVGKKSILHFDTIYARNYVLNSIIFG